MFPWPSFPSFPTSILAFLIWAIPLTTRHSFTWFWVLTENTEPYNNLAFSIKMETIIPVCKYRLKIQTLPYRIIELKWTVLIFPSSLFLVPIFTYIYICLRDGKHWQRHAVMVLEFYQEESLQIDSFPDRSLKGRVTEVIMWGGQAGLTAQWWWVCGWNRMGTAAQYPQERKLALSQREVNKVLGKEKGPGTQAKIRISASREWDKRRSKFMESEKTQGGVVS